MQLAVQGVLGANQG